MKIALVHDDFMQLGGAESLFATIARLYPKAPIYTSLVDEAKLPSPINKERIKTSFMQKIPFSKLLYKLLLPIYPLAFESFDFSKCDVVISSTTRFAKSVITGPKVVHICYINSTPRFLWDESVRRHYLPKPLVFLFSPVFSHLKRWDKAASARVDYYIANSQNVADRVERYYKQKSHVIHPFADTDFFDIPKVHSWKLKSQKYYLVVSRLVKWKKIDIAIAACAALGRNLIIVGDGPDKARLQSISTDKKAEVQFLGKVTREDLRNLYQNAKALIVTQEEDFGIATVEAGACGLPVIAYGSGGQAEIVIDGKTGILFKDQTEKSLKDAIVASTAVKWKKSACRDNSLKFSQANFEKNLKAFINSKIKSN